MESQKFGGASQHLNFWESLKEEYQFLNYEELGLLGSGG